MFRKTVWRKTGSDVVNLHQDRALNTTIFILKEFGPIGFLLKEDGESKNYKVCLGDPHSCTCPTFQKEKDLCVHICWVLIRKFRLPRDHEYCFQYGLVERQILELLQGLHVNKTVPPNDRGSLGSSYPEAIEEDGSVRQKVIEKDDICPICQEELLLKKLPVTFCKFSCGNSIHISCMKVWADHQTKKDLHTMLKCPLCREDFSTFKELFEQVKNASDVCTSCEKERFDKHLGVVCNNCRFCPIVGKCFKCTECSFFHLCEECFKRTFHPQHCFIVQMKRGQPWQTVPRTMEETQKMTQHVMGSSSMSGGICDIVPSHVIKSLPVMKVRKESRLLYPGVQCRICLSSFKLDQNVRTLPCKHKFHTGCIDPLLHKSNCCPLDWHVIYNPLTWNARGSWMQNGLAPPSVVQSKQFSEFFLPGIGLQVHKDSASSQLRKVRSMPSVEDPSPSCVGPLSQGFRDLCINSSHIEPHSRIMKRRSLHKGLSLGKAMPTTAKRRGLISSGPSTFQLTCLNVQSALASTKADRNQQRLIRVINESSSKSPACGRIRPLKDDPLGQRARPEGVDVKDLHLWMRNSPINL
ncbi:E3 ubiquitin-protein ligase ZSWIM2 [Xyrauchen texanus]|uniref:E3 ubiquitin-protein ligase ZSWIM2 n=1 Tax=Xyrauchen texanus TaxID=154827 RepID=UPI002242ABCD|nr:E3 ubiquitin-protein ligase ZSWIM2 [Xyrauchen texanus]